MRMNNVVWPPGRYYTFNQWQLRTGPSKSMEAAGPAVVVLRSYIRTLLSQDETARCFAVGDHESSEIVSSGPGARVVSLERLPRFAGVDILTGLNSVTAIDTIRECKRNDNA